MTHPFSSAAQTPRSAAAGIRFAPSPTGRFHLGNLRTAWISHEWARKLRQPWVVRFEDIDRPRVVAGARERQLDDMRELGLVPDVCQLQSDFHQRHWETFARAVRERRVYPCYCSRKEVREALDGAASAPHGPGATYSGRCRPLEGDTADMRTPVAAPPATAAHGLPSLAWRFALDPRPGESPDQLGHHDFIVARSAVALDASGLPPQESFVPAYHWACAVDDYDGNFALLVRASDLADVTSLHRAIGDWLAQSEGKSWLPPAVFHAALVSRDDGGRLEKRTQGVTLPELLSHGISVQEILKHFAASFDMTTHAYAPSRVFGESSATIRLRDLGFQLEP